jgi:hypothetical protein
MPRIVAGSGVFKHSVGKPVDSSGTSGELSTAQARVGKFFSFAPCTNPGGAHRLEQWPSACQP